MMTRDCLLQLFASFYLPEAETNKIALDHESVRRVRYLKGFTTRLWCESEQKRFRVGGAERRR
jgi:hypothetical protein